MYNTYPHLPALLVIPDDAFGGMTMKIIKANELCNYIKDNDTLMITGITLGGFAEEAFVEIGKSFDETGHPKDLTMYWVASVGNRGERGLSHVAKEGLLKRGVGGHLLGCGPAIGKMCATNAAEFYNFPQGVMSEMNRAIAEKKPGVITKVGLKTAMDPRLGGGKMNARTTEDLVELIDIHGEEWLLYQIPSIDVTIIRGTLSDEDGNISICKEGYCLGQLTAAQAAKASGGIVICQVERIVKSGTIHPKEVKVPGILVDYVFVAKPEYHWQTGQTVYNPSFSGECRIPLNDVPIEKLSPRKVIARRAAMEIGKDSIVNLGVGIPEAIGSVAAEEGVLDAFVLTTETGSIGGVPAAAHDFGCSYNPVATIEMEDQFAIYDGGILDYTCLGCLQVSPKGDVNVSMRNGTGIGVGGFVNVSTGAKKIVFASTFIGGIKKEDLSKVAIIDGKVDIQKEGNSKKFVNEIEQVSFSAEVALENKKEVLYVTERAVFKLVEGGIQLIELAPGVDLQKDVLDQMDFAPIIGEYKMMPPEIFREIWGGLKAHIEKTK